MKIYLDDARPCPIGWVLAKTAEECIALIETARNTGCFEAISLDHDLEPEHYDQALLKKADREDTYDGFRPPRTGYDVALWMVENRAFPNRYVILHSMNPVGRADMRKILTSRASTFPERCIYQIVGFRRGYEDSEPTWDPPCPTCGVPGHRPQDHAGWDPSEEGGG